MFENTRGASDRFSIREGMDVLDENDEKIGKAGEMLAGGRYFNVDAGFLGTKEYYVPIDAVTDVRDDAVYLSTTKNRLDAMGWDRRPEEGSVSQTQARGGTQAGERLQLREEELHARTQPVETGRVQVGKEIVEQERTLEVPVSREEVTIDRRPVERRPSDAPIGETGEQTIRVPVSEERVSVEKTPMVYEEVNVGKREVTETQTVSDTVRREEARIEREGDAEIRGENPAESRDA